MSFTLGQEVEFTGTVEKRRLTSSRTTYTSSRLPYSQFYRTVKTDQGDTTESWVREYTTGVIVGKRTISDHLIGGGYDEAIYATPMPGTQRSVWLVAYNLYRKPVMVSEDQIDRKSTRLNSSHWE